MGRINIDTNLIISHGLLFLIYLISMWNKIRKPAILELVILHPHVILPVQGPNTMTTETVHHAQLDTPESQQP